MSQALDDSVAAVNEVWGQDWSQRVGLLIPDSDAELRSLVGPSFSVDGIAAVAVADRVDPVIRRVEGPRVVLNPSTAGKLSETALRVVLRHEITHVAARADTVDEAPMWMLEGFADYVGYRNSGLSPTEIAPDLTRLVRAGTLPDTLPTERDFQLSGTHLELAYQRSWSLVDYLQRRVGERRLVELYRSIAGSSSASTVNHALRKMTGLNGAALLEEWRADLRDRLGR